MSFPQRLKEVREGFAAPFWVANITELFERLSYYGVNAVLAIYLHETLKLSETETGNLMGFFGGVVWFLPILGGTLADKFGFRRSLAFAYLVMSLGYFLLGSLGAPWMAPVREAVPLSTVVLIILIIPALGPAIVKPCVVGTTARASTENVRSLGYSIYYTLVNIGGTLGPLVALLVRHNLGIENVFRVCALSVFLMFFAIVVFFREPRKEGEPAAPSILQALRNFVTVVTNAKFMTFLVVFSGFWVVFWQEFIALPLYVRGFLDPQADIELLLMIDPLMVILFQIAVSHWTRKWKPFTAMTIGLFVASLSWLLLTVPALAALCNGTAGWFSGLGLSVFGHSLTLKGTSLLVGLALVVLALGEIIQSPRYYEYISRLAPEGQQGTYMGFAFLPIAIGFYISGRLGGWLVEHYGRMQQRPDVIWYVISGAGLLATVLMVVYDRIFLRKQTSPSQG